MEVFESNGVGVVDESTEQAVPLRQVADDECLLWGNPDVDKLLETATRCDHPKRTVLGAHQIHRGPHDPLEDDGQLEVFNDGKVRPQQSAQSTLRGEHILSAIHEVAERTVEFCSRLIGEGENFVVRCHVIPLPTLIK